MPKGSVTMGSAASRWNPIPQLAISETQANLRDRRYDLEGKDDRDIRSRERGSIKNSYFKKLLFMTYLDPIAQISFYFSMYERELSETKAFLKIILRKQFALFNAS